LDIHIHICSCYRLFVQRHRLLFVMALQSLFPNLYLSIDDFENKGGHVRRRIVSNDFFFLIFRCR
jgi:hypothetical protein